MQHPPSATSEGSSQKGASGNNTDFDEAVHGRQTPNPETALLLAERTELLSKSLAELPVQLREVLERRELEQLSYQDIANIAGIPLGTVRTRLNRARQQLQDTLLDYMELEYMGRRSK